MTKVTLTHKPKIHYLDSSKAHGIGSLTDEINVVLRLSDEEVESLTSCMIESRGDNNLALNMFTHRKKCTKHHRYKIWNAFKGGIDITDIDIN